MSQKPIPIEAWSRSLTLLLAGILCGLAPVLSGCSKSPIERQPVHPVQGQVTWQGKPLAGALVVLHPKSKEGPSTYSARGQTDQQGRFQLTTYDSNDGAPLGDYAVTVQYYQVVQDGASFEPGPNVLSPRLASPDSSDILVTVAEGPNQLAPIEVFRGTAAQ